MRPFALVIVAALITVGALYYVFRSEVLNVTELSTPAATTTGRTNTSTDGTLAAQGYAGPTVAIAGKTLRVAVADTPEERTQGLSGAVGLGADEGMLFIFEREGIYGFWMKDMKFAIDIIWLDSGGEVVHIIENATPESYPASFSSQKAAQYVLEVNAGFAEAHNIATGTKATIVR